MDAGRESVGLAIPFTAGVAAASYSLKTFCIGRSVIETAASVTVALTILLICALWYCINAGPSCRVHSRRAICSVIGKWLTASGGKAVLRMLLLTAGTATALINAIPHISAPETPGIAEICAVHLKSLIDSIPFADAGSNALVKAFLNINEVLACIMTNWIAANLVTWMFDRGSLFENLQNTVENTKTAYIYKTSFNGVETSKMGLDLIFPNSQVNGGILIAIVIAILMYILMNKTTLGYELKACGANRHAARYAGISDKRNIVLSMAIAGALSGAAASLYYLAGNTEFFWSTYQSLPATGFNGIPVALLAASNPIGVIFTGCFMSMLDIVGLQLTNLTAYNEYITDVIIAVIVYLSAFSLVIKLWLSGRGKKHKAAAAAEPAPAPADAGDAKGGEAK